MLTRLLTRIAPATLLVAVLSILAGTGFYLRWTPRMKSLAWGLTEMIHVHVGWVSLALLAGYLAHHLTRTWGPLRTRQRLLGLGLLADVLVALLTGVVLVLGLSGGPPAWVRPVHLATTVLLLFLVPWHTAPGWRAWARRRWRRLIDGPPA